VDQARALKVRLAFQVSCRVHQDLLDAPGPADELGIARHQHCRGARDVGSGHGRAVHALNAAAWNGRGDLLTWRQDVGLATTVAGRSAGGEVAYAIEMRIASMGRTDGDDQVGISGVSDADRPVATAKAALLRARAVFKPGVTSGRYYDRTGSHEAIA